jgi:hypothetical protein
VYEALHESDKAAKFRAEYAANADKTVGTSK